MTRYDPGWVSTYYDAIGDQEWRRWDTDAVQAVKFHVHRHYLEQYVRPGDRVLEIGAGPGRFTQVLAKIGARVTVSDISQVQLDLNRRHADELGFENAVEERIQLDICDLRVLKNAAFDTVVCYGGPLSYVFERRELALKEMLRVLRPSGALLLGVIGLWGSVHQFLPMVLAVSPQENAEILRTGDSHPDTFSSCTHRMHMFRSAELRALLESAGAEVVAMSASNCLSAVWKGELDEIRKDEAKWSELLRMEIEASREPGCLDAGTHLIAVARKS